MTRPDILSGKTRKVKTDCGNMYITINYKESQPLEPIEVFSVMGKSGKCTAAYNEALARLISLALQEGVKVDSIAKQLIGIQCATQGGTSITSCPDAIARELMKKEEDRYQHLMYDTGRHVREPMKKEEDR